MARLTLLALIALLATLLLGCPTGSRGDNDDDDSGPTEDDDDATDPGPQPAELTELTDGECPDLSAPGVSTFSSAGHERTVHTFFPDDAPEGMPVVFFWHALGTTAQEWIGWMDLDGLADDLGAIVFVPESRSAMAFEWEWTNGETADGPLFDDLRTCAAQELGADMHRVAVSGFSAGALWTTWLMMHRADTLATAFIMSGGVIFNLPYAEPAEDLPVYLMSGGATDVYAGGMIDFEAATEDLQAELLDDGHFVVRCRHTLGHTTGPSARPMMEAWLGSHAFGQESPWSTGDEEVSDLADYCFVAPE